MRRCRLPFFGAPRRGTAGPGAVGTAACPGGHPGGVLPTPLERAGTGPSRAGPYFFGEIGERTPRGRRFLPLGTPFSGGKNGGRWLVRLEPGLRPPEPTPHGPPTGSGGREKWFVDGRKKWEIERVFSTFSQRAPTHVPSPPSRWAGRYEPFAVRAAGQVSRKRYSLPPHNPTREGGPGGGTSSPGGSFPHFFPRNRAPPGRAKFLPVPTAQGKNAPARDSPLPHSRKEVTTGSVTAQRMVLRKFTREAKVSSTP